MVRSVWIHRRLDAITKPYNLILITSYIITLTSKI
jgi:hypothetical protein